MGLRVALTAVCFAVLGITYPDLPQAAEQSSNAKVVETYNSDLAEIVVTATRHEESLSKVPISISAFTQESLDQKGIKDFADVARFTPGVTIDSAGTDAISIRGIASSSGAGTTGIYIDDTPIQIRALGFGPDDTLPKTFDLDRVEVLRGPQGTLFGAGSEGGTVRYILAQPSLHESSTYVRSEGADTKNGAPSYELGIAHGAPIIDGTLGYRASVWYREDGGWIDRADPYTNQTLQRNANHAQNWVARLAFIWQPIDALSVTPSFIYQERKRYNVDGFWPTRSDPANDRFVEADPTGLTVPDSYSLSALKAEWNLGRVKLISNSSWYSRHERTGYEGTLYNLGYYQAFGWPGSAGLTFTNPALYPLLDATGIHLPADLQNYRATATIINEQSVATQELRLQSNDPGSRFNWTIGAFWSLSKGTSQEEIHEPQIGQLFQGLFGVDYSSPAVFGSALLPNGDSYSLRNVGFDRQLAAFGELSYSITDTLKATVGGRISKTQFDYSSYGDGPTNYGPSGFSGTDKETPFTPKLGLSWQVDANDLLYTTYSKGFRPGGANSPLRPGCGQDLVNLGLTGAPESFKSDTVKSYEVGAKNNINDRLKLATSIYYIQWQGIQQSVYLPGCGLQFTGNFGQAVSKGFDLQADVALSRALSFETAIGYNSARFTKNSPGDLVVTGDAIVGQGGPPAPWTAAAGLDYKFPIAGQMGFVRFDYQYQRRNHWLTAAEDPRSTQYDPYAFTAPTVHFASLRGGVTIGDYTATLFVDNLFDTSVITGSAHSGLDFYNPNGPPAPLQYNYSSFRPRTMGVQLAYRH
jgi:iron complex outermembrane receptor protein